MPTTPKRGADCCRKSQQAFLPSGSRFLSQDEARDDQDHGDPDYDADGLGHVRARPVGKGRGDCTGGEDQWDGHHDEQEHGGPALGEGAPDGRPVRRIEGRHVALADEHVGDDQAVQEAPESAEQEGKDEVADL
jgi:hypothetical protein